MYDTIVKQEDFTIKITGLEFPLQSKRISCKLPETKVNHCLELKSHYLVFLYFLMLVAIAQGKKKENVDLTVSYPPNEYSRKQEFFGGIALGLVSLFLRCL